MLPVEEPRPEANITVADEAKHASVRDKSS
jgi:hypothetical protein